MNLPWKKEEPKQIEREEWTWTWCEEMDKEAHFFMQGQDKKRFVITSIHASYQHWALVGYLIVLVNGLQREKHYVHGQRDLIAPVETKVGESVSICLQTPYRKFSEPTAPCLTVKGYTEIFP